MDDSRYNTALKQKMSEFEGICRRCGLCCGVKDDACRNLEKDGNKYKCIDYENRLGPQKTLSGKSFHCVPIREHIANRSLHPGCAYNELLKYKKFS